MSTNDIIGGCVQSVQKVLDLLYLLCFSLSKYIPCPALLKTEVKTAG